MDSQESKKIVEQFWTAINTNDFDLAGEFLHDSFVLEWPQSRERIRGRANWIAVNKNYPAAGPWRITIDRIIADEIRIVSEVMVTDGKIVGRAITFSEIQDSKIINQTEYWPDPFEPAVWRAQWVERMP